MYCKVGLQSTDHIEWMVCMRESVNEVDLGQVSVRSLDANLGRGKSHPVRSCIAAKSIAGFVKASQTERQIQRLHLSNLSTEAPRLAPANGAKPGAPSRECRQSWGRRLHCRNDERRCKVMRLEVRPRCPARNENYRGEPPPYWVSRLIRIHPSDAVRPRLHP